MKSKEIKWNRYWGCSKIFAHNVNKNRPYQEIVYVLCKLTTENSNCIEIGCGSGTYSIELISRGRKCLATDIVEEALELTKAKGKCLYGIDVPTMNVDLFNMPFDDNTFDLIFCDGVIEHIDIQKALDAMSKKLKPGGWFVASVPSGNFLYKIAYYTLSFMEKRNMHEEWHTDKEWIGFGEKAGLKNMNIMKCGGFFVGIFKRFFATQKLIKYIPNIERIHYILYGQK